MSDVAKFLKKRFIDAPKMALSIPSRMLSAVEKQADLERKKRDDALNRSEQGAKMEPPKPARSGGARHKYAGSRTPPALPDASGRYLPGAVGLNRKKRDDDSDLFEQGAMMEPPKTDVEKRRDLVAEGRRLLARRKMSRYGLRHNKQ